ncbi:MAG: hypothetical protein OER80_13165 [Gammaproteobacteria bacterium]|nr:hypothetical protein [Gammaproteobacteria bacterium]
MSLLSRKYLSLILASALLVAVPAGAAEYSLQAIIDQRAFYNGNLGMFSDPASTAQDQREMYASGYALAPRLNLRARSPRWQLDLNSVASFSRLSDQLYDSDDQKIGLKYGYTGARARWDVDASIDRSSTRSNVAELGEILAAVRSESYSLTPRWTRVLSERNSLALGGNWASVDYQARRFNDYDYYGFDITWLRQLSEQNQLQIGVYQSIFEAGEKRNNTDIESDTLGLTVALVRNVNEALSTNISIGARQVETSTPILCDFVSALFGQCTFGSRLGVNTTDSDGFTAAAGVDYTAQRWSVSASLSRSLVPNSTLGDLLETDTVTLSFNRQLRETLYFELDLSATQEDQLESNSFSRDRFRIAPRLRWQFAERWSMTTSVVHNSRDSLRFGSSNDAEGTSISFRVRYTHPRESWSR